MGQTGSSQLLLRSGASVNLTGPQERSPLMLACAQPSMEALVDTLLNYEGDPCQKDVRGWTALEWVLFLLSSSGLLKLDLFCSLQPRFQWAPFQFATRGHCIKGKQCHRIAIANKNMSLWSEQSSLFPFYVLPPSVKLKGAIVLNV